MLILDINSLEANIYLLAKGESLIKETLRGELQLEYVAEDRNEITARGLVLLREAVDREIKHVVRKFALSTNLYNLAKLRWVIGTGEVLTYLPNSIDTVREALAKTKEVAFSEGGFPVLIDQYNIFTSVGALTKQYREATWQLVLESLGVV